MPKPVAFLFDDVTEFYCMKNAIDDCASAGIDFDIIVPEKSGYNGLSEYTIGAISAMGYKVINHAGEGKYQILFEPYNLVQYLDDIDYEYRIKYRYSLSMLAKPYVLAPEWNIFYDAILTSCLPEVDYIQAYTRAIISKPCQYRGFKRGKNKSSKPRLLIVPTFGDLGSVLEWSDEMIDLLNENYTVTVKAHHATQFRTEEKRAFDKLRSIASNFYDQDRSIADLLSEADVVLSDSSGAIFDAIYTNTPVVVLANSKAGNRFDNTYYGIKSLQQELVDEGLLVGNTVAGLKQPTDLIEMIDRAIKSTKQIKQVRTLVFGDESRSVEIIDVIHEYLNKPSNTPAHKIRKMIVDDMRGNRARIVELERQNADLSEKIRDLENALSKRIGINCGVYSRLKAIYRRMKG